MNILLLYYEPAPSGQTTHVLALARALHRQGYNVTVVLPARLEQGRKAFQQAGVHVAPIAMRKTIWPAASARALLRLIRSTRPDIVHVHSQEAGIPGRVLARLARFRSSRPFKVVYTPQTIDIRRANWRWLYVGIERALALVTDAIISVNEADRARLARWGVPPHKLVAIPNGIDLSAFQGPVEVRDLRRSLALDPERPLVMQVARLSAQKDPLAFVEGAAQVLRERPDVQFALLGDGPLQPAVESRVQALGLDAQVRLLGWRERGDRLLAAADVATLTSRWEGTPYSLLEAMAWSRPVVATAVNGCSEVVVEGKTGFVVPAGDAAAWAGRVLALLNDPPLADRMGKEGRRRVENRFSLDSTIEQTENLYRRVGGLCP